MFGMTTEKSYGRTLDRSTVQNIHKHCVAGLDVVLHRDADDVLYYVDSDTPDDLEWWATIGEARVKVGHSTTINGRVHIVCGEEVQAVSTRALLFLFLPVHTLQEMQTAESREPEPAAAP